jgi:hypothetical protein
MPRRSANGKSDRVSLGHARWYAVIAALDDSATARETWQHVEFPPNHLGFAMVDQWYVRVDGEQYGPYTTDQLKTYAAEGHITPTSEIRRGDGPWCLATKVKGMFPQTAAMAPPLPTAAAPPSARMTVTNARDTEAERILYSDSPSMFRNNPLGFLLSLLLCVVGVGVIILIIWYLKCYGTQLTVTNKRTTLRTGILSKHINEVFHRDVRNVRLGQTFLQRVFGVGTIELSSSGQSDVEISVTGMPDPENIKSLIDEYHD